MTDPAPDADTGETLDPRDVNTVLEVLLGGTLEVEGRLLDASNATLYCSLECDGITTAVVYKPVRGERPLWDFPDGTLAGREVAAFEMSQATGWSVVPPTVLRDGPFGEGMCQIWIDADDSVDLAALARSDVLPLRRMALLDAVINNADRKGGHLLPLPDGHVFGVDHGVCFHAEDKLRTLLWGWRGQPLDDEEIDVLSQLRAELEGPLGDRLLALIQPYEVTAVAQRVDRLLTRRVFPAPTGEWPALPWPPF